MINVTEITTSRGLEAAEKKAEQAKRQIANEKKKLNADRRKKETHLKIIAGGIIHKYFPDSFLFEEHEMDEIIKTCSVCDAHGLLITEDVKGNKNTPRHSVVEFAWTVGIPGKNGTETYIHSKLVSDSGAKGSATESNEGQNLFHRPANYGEYAFICNIEVYRIGLNDINRTYPIDDNDREKRYQAILVSLISSMLNPEGAMTSSQKPHVTGFKGVVSWSHKLVPAPTVSALNSDYIKQIENVAENVNNIYKTLNNNETINVVETEEFKNISDFVSIINKLLKDQPYKIHD